jgi:hypothetical protein
MHVPCSVRVFALTLISLTVVTATVPPDTDAAEQVVPAGTVVDKTNLDKYSQYLSPAMAWIVERGVKLPVREYKRVDFPPPFRAATEKYAAQVTLSADGLRKENHVAGLPFPSIDPNDPHAGTKHMFNFDAAIAVDDLDLRNFDCDTGSVGKDGDPLRVERHFLIDHIRRLYWVERLEVEPKPVNPDNPDGVRYKEALYPIREPFDLTGTGFTFNRYLDSTRQDDSWLYLPQLRRVRRLSSAQRSDALFGQDTDQDSYAGYAGNVAWMTWKYLGEKTLLASFHSEHLPVKWGAGSANFMHDDAWEPRDVWVVEGVSKLPQYAYGKRVIFLDKESYRIPYTDIYDQAGELWKIWVNNFKYAKEPIPGAKYGFDYEVSFNPSITMVDMQLQHATHCSLPSDKFPGEQGWYVNLGDEEGTPADVFALSAIISASR